MLRHGRRLLPLVVLAGCAHAPPVHRPARPAGLDPTERLLVTREPGTEPMEVVTNAQAAGDRFLRTPAREVDPGAPGVAHLVRRMRASLAREQGVGIAAPQVGISRRVALAQRFDAVGHRRQRCEAPRCPVQVYFNPRILERSGQRAVGWEGCLSVPAGFGQVSRHTEIVVRYQDRRGEWREERVPGFTARILQHEIDHLDGVLFIDRKEPGKLLSEQDYRKMRAAQQPSSRPAGGR